MSQVYRVWDELLPPMRPLTWWLIRHRLLGPGAGTWLRKAENGVRTLAAERGLTLIGDPLSGVIVRDRRVFVAATALAEGPPGLAELEEEPVDIVDRDQKEAP